MEAAAAGAATALWGRGVAWLFRAGSAPLPLRVLDGPSPIAIIPPLSIWLAAHVSYPPPPLSSTYTHTHTRPRARTHMYTLHSHIPTQTQAPASREGPDPRPPHPTSCTLTGILSFCSRFHAAPAVKIRPCGVGYQGVGDSEGGSSSCVAAIEIWGQDPAAASACREGQHEWRGKGGAGRTGPSPAPTTGHGRSIRSVDCKRQLWRQLARKAIWHAPGAAQHPNTHKQ